MTPRPGPGPRDLLEDYLARWHVDRLAQAVRDAQLGEGAQEQLEDLEKDVNDLCRHIIALDDHIMNLTDKVDAVLTRPRWTIHIDRTGITITRGEDKGRLK